MNNVSQTDTLGRGSHCGCRYFFLTRFLVKVFRPSPVPSEPEDSYLVHLPPFLSLFRGDPSLVSHSLSAPRLKCQKRRASTKYGSSLASGTTKTYEFNNNERFHGKYRSLLDTCVNSCALNSHPLGVLAPAARSLSGSRPVRYSSRVRGLRDIHARLQVEYLEHTHAPKPKTLTGGAPTC